VNAKYPLAMVAELIGDPVRAAMLVALLDRGELAAGELALLSGASPQSASAHLSKLTSGGLLKRRSNGRHRYYRLAGTEVARAIEALGVISTRTRVARAHLSEEALAMHTARSCYDHLAGRVSVALAQFLESSRVLKTCGRKEYALGSKGADWFAKLGIDVGALSGSQRSFALQCLDWTERKPHVAGALGAALLSRMLALRWIARRRESRALRITNLGAQEFRSRFGILV
jgi:DNA-binding transcriptional ArsR family regulator